MELTIKQAAWHRNGVAGVGFYAIVFEDKEHGLMVASLFDEPGYCAVYTLAGLAKSNVAFGENSWRGDRYEAALRPLLETWLKENSAGRAGPFSVINVPRKP